MKKVKQTKRFLAIMLIGLFIFSCNKDELTEGVSSKKQKTDVSVDLAQHVALSFSKTDEFMGIPDKNRLLYARSSSPFPGFEEKDIDEVIIIPDDKESPAMYIITFSPNGYIIVSATTKESPILGFSTDSKFQFDDIPLGLAEWLVGRMDKIQTLKYTEGLEIPIAVTEEWAERAPSVEEERRDTESGGGIRSGGTEHRQVGPLLQTLWGQGVRYNDLVNDGNLSCSGYSNGNAPTGCVATAVAQIMRFHQHPNTYRWAIMPNIIRPWEAQSNRTLEVAELMRDIGDAVGMNYTCDGSGAKTENAKNALINNFGYSSSASYVDYNLNSVVSELNSNRPVIMDGYHTSYTTGWWIFSRTNYRDGHAWVCDGWRETIYKTIHNPDSRYEYTTSRSAGKFLHMNWGWSGTRMGSNDNNG